MLLLCNKGHIERRFFFPGEVWVVPPVGVVGIVVWLMAGCLYWPTALACSATKALTKGTLGNALLGAQWTVIACHSRLS